MVHARLKLWGCPARDRCDPPALNEAQLRQSRFVPGYCQPEPGPDKAVRFFTRTLSFGCGTHLAPTDSTLTDDDAQPGAIHRSTPPSPRSTWSPANLPDERGE
jgi:hypothetical protein